MAEATLNDISAQLKEQNQGEKKQTAVLQEIAKSVAGPSASQQAELDQEKKPAPESGGGGGAFGGGALKGIMGMFKSIGGFLRKLKAGLLFLLLPAVLTFINSPLFQKAISFIQETIMPALKKIIGWFGTLFTDPVQALKDLWDGFLSGAADFGSWLWNEGIKPFWDWVVDVWSGMDWAALWKASIDNLANIGTWIWNKGVKPFWDWIKKIWEGMDWSALWSASIDNLANIGTWIWNKGVKPFWTWISDIWKGMDWSQLWSDMLKGAADFGGWLWNSAIKPFWTWISPLFSPEGGWKAYFTGLWDSLTGKAASVGSWIWDHSIGPIWDWVTGIFKWGTTEEDEADDTSFSLSGLLKTMIDGIKTWLEKMFKFDSASDVITSIVNVVTFVPNILKDMIAGVTTWLLSIFGFDDAAKKVANANNWTIGSLVTGVVEDIISWFGKIFDIDMKAIFREMAGAAGKAGSWILKTLGLGGGEKEPGDHHPDKDAGDVPARTFPNTAPPGFGTTPIVYTHKEPRQGTAAWTKEQALKPGPTRQEEMGSLAFHIRDYEKRLAKTGGKPEFRNREQAEGQLLEMQLRLAELQAAQMRFDEATRRAEAQLLNNFNAGPPGITSTNVTISAPSTSTTTAVSNVSESLQGASDPYVAIGGAR